MTMVYFWEIFSKVDHGHEARRTKLYVISEIEHILNMRRAENERRKNSFPQYIVSKVIPEIM